MAVMAADCVTAPPAFRTTSPAAAPVPVETREFKAMVELSEVISISPSPLVVMSWDTVRASRAARDILAVPVVPVVL